MKWTPCVVRSVAARCRCCPSSNRLRVPGADLRRHRHLPGELLIIPDAHRHGDDAPELGNRPVFCLHRRAFCAQSGLNFAHHKTFQCCVCENRRRFRTGSERAVTHVVVRAVQFNYLLCDSSVRCQKPIRVFGLICGLFARQSVSKYE